MTRCRRGASSGRPRRARRETVPRGEVEKRRGGSGDGEAGLAGEGGAWPAMPASSRCLHSVRGKKQRRERDGVRAIL